MIKKINVLTGMRVLDINTSLDKGLNDILSVSKIKRIEMSEGTFEHRDMVSKRLNGDYSEYYTVVPDMDFGRIKVIWINYGTCNDENYYTMKMLEEEFVVDMSKLNESIIIESPKYLVMCRNTLSILIDNDNCDMYCMNDKACYHSYKNVIIAISEFLSPGVIDLIS